MTIPRFSKNQQVCFIGGVGTILGYRLDSSTWVYAIEMEMELEPPMGKVGAPNKNLTA